MRQFLRSFEGCYKKKWNPFFVIDVSKILLSNKHYSILIFLLLGHCMVPVHVDFWTGSVQLRRMMDRRRWELVIASKRLPAVDGMNAFDLMVGCWKQCSWRPRLMVPLPLYRRARGYCSASRARATVSYLQKHTRAFLFNRDFAILSLL